jgi:hypothetical protein
MSEGQGVQMLGAHGKMVPRQRQKVLDFARAEVLAGRSFPGPTAVARHMGWKGHGSAKDALFKLATYDRVIVRHQDGSYALDHSTREAAPKAVLPQKAEGSFITPLTKAQLMAGRARP